MGRGDSGGIAALLNEEFVTWISVAMVVGATIILSFLVVSPTIVFGALI